MPVELSRGETGAGAPPVSFRGRARTSVNPTRRPGIVPPRLLARAALAARRGLLALADAIVPPQLALFEQGAGLARTQLLHVAARLRIADLLHAGPRAAADLAREIGVHPDALHRALRALASSGVFRLLPDGRFANTRLSSALMAGTPASMRDFLEYLGCSSNVASWADVERTIATGKNGFERVHGMSVWEWFDRHPGEGRTFAAAMSSLTEIDAPAIAAGYPFGELATVCDVAGGRGGLLAEILRRHPGVRGVLLDAPKVLEDAPAFLAARGVAERVRCVPGSFFEAVPGSCDGYVLKDILHDWDDPTCLRILASCRRAMRPGAKLVVAEILVEPLSAASPGALVDVQMMTVCVEGRQRSVSEHQGLLRRAGLEPGRVVALPGAMSLVEGTAA